MKNNKGLVTILANLAEFILQARIAPSQTFKEHLDTLQNQLRLLRSQSFPQTDIIHFLVRHHPYKMKTKINEFLQTATLGQLALTIIFTITSKLTLETQVAEIWRFMVVLAKGRKVPRENTVHQLLYLVGRIFEQLTSREFLNQQTSNREAQRQYIIDFQIKLNQQNIHNFTLNELGKLTFNSTSFDNTYQVQTRCYTNPKHFLANSIDKTERHSKTEGGYYPAKNSLETTRGGSFNEQQLVVNRKFISQSTIYQINDSELDLAILSCGSHFLSPKQVLSAVQQQPTQQFELLAEEKDKDELFLEANMMIFNNWQGRLLQNFT